MNILASFLQGPLKVAFQKSLSKADDGDNIITKAEFEDAKKAFSNTDEFGQLSLAEKKALEKKLDADILWKKHGASAVTNYDGMEKQTEHYQGLLNSPARNKGADGKPLVTQAQLNYARENGFGDIDGKNGIDGLELAVADLDGKNGRGAKNGDLNGDGKVNKDDRGIDLGSSKSTSGFDTKMFLELLQKIMQIWVPNAPVMKIPTTQKP